MKPIENLTEENLDAEILQWGEILWNKIKK